VREVNFYTGRDGMRVLEVGLEDDDGGAQAKFTKASNRFVFAQPIRND
jgi:hypothetical protein